MDSGTVDPNIKTTFRIISWEGEFEFIKWFLEIDRFFKHYYPNVKVEINWGVDWNTYWTKLPTMLAAGDVPDLIWMHDTRNQTFAAKGMLLPLDDYIKKLPPLGWPYDFYPSQVASFQYKGKQYGIPYDFAPGGFYFNKTMFDKAGVSYPPEWATDWTFDDMLEKAKKLTKDINGDGKIDEYGVQMPTGGWNTYWVIRSFGGDLFNQNTKKATLTNPNTVKALQFIADCAFKWKVHPVLSATDAQRAFVSGKVGMQFSLNDEAFGIDKVVGDNFKWGVAPSPKGPVRRAQFVGGSALAIPKGAKNADIAYELIRYMLSNPECLPTNGRVGSQIVLRKSFYPYALNESLYKKLPNYYYVFAELGSKDGVMPWYFPGFQEYDALWSRYMDPVFVTGKMSAKEALSKYQIEAQKILDQIKE
jgi:multiple sugar transport system substrate-binding protein